jgi:uncharacterized protein Yka (UPF0111/DUF47 family)
MFSLKKFFGKEDTIFKLLEASATEAHQSVQALVQLSKSLDVAVKHEEFARSRSTDKQITSKIRNAIHTHFDTPLDREDIDELARALYRIPKTVEKFVDRVLVVPQQVRGVDFSRQISILEQATECVVQLIKSLCGGVNLEEVRQWNDRLQQLEIEADKVIIEIYRDLFNGQHDLLKVIVLKELYEMLEKIIDRCHDVGDVISQIALKYS